MRLRNLALGLPLALGLLATGLPALAPGAQAMTLQEAQQRLKDIQTQLAHDKQMLQQTANTLVEQRRALQQVHSNLDSTTKALDDALNWEATLGKRITFKQAEITSTQAKLDTDQTLVGSALRGIEEEGPGGYLSVLFGAQSFSDFETRLGLLGQIIQSDIKVIQSVQKTKSVLQQEKQTLTQERAQYAAAASVRKQAQSALQQQESYQRQAVANLDLTYSKAQGAVHMDEGNSTEVQQIIQSLESSGNGSGIYGIHFIWPVVGPITSPFGWRLDPVIHKWGLHSGVDVGVPWGTPIHAAASGRVIVAQWLTGYGYTIIIDDGDGISNLYAHQERFNVSVGDSVRQGQVIGYVGATGWATGPHLHFEVRIGGKPENPMKYMPPMP